MIAEITKAPSVVQKNFSAITDDMKEHIQSGTQCDFNPTLEYQLHHCVSVFNGKTNKLSLVFLIIGIASVILEVISLLSMSYSDTEKRITISTIITSAVFPVVMLAIYFRMHAEIKEFEKVISLMISEKGTCLKYNLTSILRHEFFESEYRSENYYCDLGGFCVLTEYHPERWNNCRTAYGAIININQKEFFILFHCE